MIKQLKQTLLKMVKLPLRDQQWVLQQLTSEELHVFHCHKGNLRLQQARKFKHIQLLPETEQLDSEPVPEWYSELKAHSPLFQAIILSNGQFSWSPQESAEVPSETLMTIKPKTQDALFQQWQSQLNFKAHMDGFDG